MWGYGDALNITSAAGMSGKGVDVSVCNLAAKDDYRGATPGYLIPVYDIPTGVLRPYT